MLKLRVRCLSKNSGEVFYEYETKKLLDLETANQKLDVAKHVFFKRLMSDLMEDCTFEFTVLHCREELPIDFESVEVEDYNETPVVF